MRHLSDARAVDRSGLEVLPDDDEGDVVQSRAVRSRRRAGARAQSFLAKAFVRRNDELKAALPPERLLVWSAKDGWGAAVRVPRGADSPTSRSRRSTISGHFRRMDDRAGAARRSRSTARTESRELEGAAGRR